MPVPRVLVTSQINCGDVTMLIQKKNGLSDNAKSAIDNCFSGMNFAFRDIKLRVRNKMGHSLPWITVFGLLVMRFANNFHAWLRRSWKVFVFTKRLARSPKIVILGSSCIIFIYLPKLVACIPISMSSIARHWVCVNYYIWMIWWVSLHTQALISISSLLVENKAKLWRN